MNQGDSLLASALISPRSWCLVRRDKCPLAQSRLTASISQWYALCRYLGVILTPSLRWTDHVNHLTARGFGTTTWCSEDLPVSFGSLLLSTNMLPSTTFGLEFAGESPSRSLTLNASVLSELGIFDSSRMAHGQTLSFFGRLTALDSGTRTPLPAAVFRLAIRVPGTWAHWCRSLLVHHSCWLPELSGVGPRCTPSTLRRWFARGVAPALDLAWRQRLVLGLSALHTVRFDCSSSDFTLNHMIYGRGVDPADARWWGLARHGHDPMPWWVHS